MSLPNRIYAQIFAKRGNNLKKAPKWKPTYGINYRATGEMGYNFHGFEGFKRGSGINLLDKSKETACRYFFVRAGEYSFWSQCRACEQHIWTAKDRNRHLTGPCKCGKYLTRAYKRLLRDKKCLVCDQSTSNTRWGVPLCDVTNCMFIWKYSETYPFPALQEALRLEGFDSEKV